MKERRLLTRQERFQRLIDISRDLASTLDLDELLDRIVHAAIDLTNSQAAAILLYEESKGELYFQASTNLERPIMRGITVPVESSIAGWIAINRQPVIANDPASDPRFYKDVQKQANLETKSLLGVPMITKRDVVGVLETINKYQGGFNEEDQDILMTLGAQAAVAILNARLFIQADLISEMVHELRTPLASLNAATHILLRSDISQKQHHEMVRVIQDETSRLSDMATSFLDLARLEAGRGQFNPLSFDIAGLLKECTGIMQSRMDERQIELQWEVEEQLPMMVGDPDKIKQVFLNLLSNAIKYNREQGSIRIFAAEKKTRIEISISDTGQGIPADSLDLLFEKFYRVPGTERMAQGTGLGLSIVRKIIHAHGGEVRVDSQVGQGSTFSVFLPKTN